jgi:hypothetical protein
MVETLASDSMKDLDLHIMRAATTTEFTGNRSFFLGVGRVLWNVIRVPIVAVLLLLEPVVSFVCSAGLVLGVLTCIVWELSAAGPKFPLGKMLLFSFGCPVILFLYHAVLSLFVSDPRNRGSY